MKILHVWNQAGTASIIAKWQRKIGHEVIVIQNSKHDKIKCTYYYRDMTRNSKIKFVLKCIRLAKHYDIIHLHDAWFVVLPIRILYPKKKIIMHYHGSLVRLGMKETRRKIWERFVDKIIVSTPDLLEFRYKSPPVYVPNPVDTELFHSRAKKNNGKCVISLKKDQSINVVDSLLYDHGIDVGLDEVKGIEYEKFPEKLKEYEFYADIPMSNGKIIQANSMCGLQAMSMGIKVISYDFKITDKLP